MAVSNEGIELKVFSYADPTVYIDTIQEAQAKQYLEGLGEVGSGQFHIALDEPKTTTNPSLLDYRNVCKYSINGKIVGAFLLENNKKILVAEGERSEERKEISGEGLLTWLNEVSVGPMITQTKYGAEKRYFNFGSTRGTWYKDSDWNPNPPISGSWGDNPWKKRPTNWPKDHKAKWIKASTNQWNNVQSLFRLEFNTGDDGGRWLIWAAADDYLEMWLDGEKIADTDFEKSSLDEAVKIELTNLPAGNHVLAARVTNDKLRSSFMAAIYHPGVESQDNNPKTLRLWTGQDQAGQPHWYSMFLGDNDVPMPVWTPGQIILQLIAEGKARGNKAMGWLKPTFTGTKDSNGVNWLTTQDDWEFDIGQDTIYTVMQKISEKLGYYFWIDPDTLNLNMAQYRGTDKATDPNAIVFELGKNLATAELEGVGGKRRNSFYAKGADGWLIDPSTRDAASIAKYGVLEGYYSADMPRADVKRVMPAIIKQTAMAEEGATYNIITDEYEPWQQFGNGDLVIAPDKDGLNVKRQVVSISFQENEDTGEPDYTLEFDVIFQTQQKKLELAITKLTGGSAGSGLASSSGLGSTQLQPALPPATAPTPSTPLIPQNVASTSDGTWTPDGITPVSTVHLTWDPVVLDTDGNEIITQYYEVWGTKATEPMGTRLLTSSTTNSVDITPLVPGELWNFQVRAFIDQSSAPSDFSTVITYAGEGPNDPLPAPSAPILSTAMGLLTVSWDGILIDEAEPAPQFRYVYAQVAVGEQGPWNISGTAISRGGGDMTIPGLIIGDTYFVRLRAVDGMGLVSEPSAIAQITIEGVDLGPLKEELDAAIDAVAKSVASVRENVNMLENPSFDQPTAPDTIKWTLGAGAALSQAQPRTGSWHVAITTNGQVHDVVTYESFLPVDPGTSFYLKFYVGMDSGNADPGELEMGMYVKANESDAPTYVKMADSLQFDDSGYQIFQGYITVPENMRWVQPVVRTNDPTAGDVIYLDDARMFVMTDDTTVVPGSINADALAAASVIAGKVAAGAIDTDALQAESIIGIHIKSQEITGDKMAFNTLTGNHMEVGSIGVESLSPSIGEELDISANGAVNIIVGRIQDIEDSNYAQNSDLEQMQTYYAFTDDGAVVSTPGSPFAVAVRSDRIEMLENGNPVSYWNSGTLYVDQMVGSSVVLGNHQLEQYGTGTVVRAIS